MHPNSTMFCYLTFALYVPYLIKRFRVDNVLKLASLLSCSGALMRTVAIMSNSIGPVIFGTFLMAASQPLFFGCQFNLINTWFADGERATAMAIFGSTPFLANFVSLTLMGLLTASIDGTHESRVNLHDTILKVISTVTILQVVVGLGFYSLMFAAIAEKPESPPSAVAVVQPSDDVPLGHGIATLGRNRNFMKILCVRMLYSLTFCIATSLLLNNMHNTIPTKDVFFSGASCNLHAFVGTLLAGAVLDFTNLYKCCTVFAGSTAILSAIILILTVAEIGPTSAFFVKALMAAMVGAGLTTSTI